MAHENLKSKLETLPLLPGCYLMKNNEGKVIYVGKAKKLKNRVNQYFHGSHNYKTTKMVSQIDDFEFIVTNSEKEALILENNLIKKHRPRFNILMMDDKTYPYLRLTNEKYPRFYVVRDVKDKKAKHFGPYSDSTAAYNTMKLINRIYPLRKCVHIPNKECLYYHLGQCLAPCIKDLNDNAYSDIVKSVTSFMRGDTADVIADLKNQMLQASEEMNFELAKELRDLVNSIEHVADKQRMENQNNGNFDVFSYHVDKGYIAIAGMLVQNGKLLEREIQVFDIYDDEVEVFISFLMQYYSINPIPKELYLDSNILCPELEEVYGMKILQPTKGEKANLLKLAKNNAIINLNQKFEVAYRENTKEMKINNELAKLFKINDLKRIEMFDNSHINGSDRVSGMIVVEEGKFKRSDYRRFIIKTDAKDDLSMMKEVVYRRYFRLLKEGQEFPSVLLMDGGRLQIDAAKEIISALGIDLPVFGLVKDDRHRTANLMDSNGNIIELDRKSDVFFFLTNMQDEVHRYAIAYHKQKRSSHLKESELDKIDGIGKVRKDKLYKTFKSVKRIKEATLEEIQDVIGEVYGKKVYEYFHS